MRTMYVVLVMTFGCALCGAQGSGGPAPRRIPEAPGAVVVHTIPVQSKRNVFDMAIINHYGTIGSDQLALRVSGERSKMLKGGAPYTVSPAMAQFAPPEENGLTHVSFSIDVSASAVPGQVDTLFFLVIGRKGAVVYKKAVLKYVAPEYPAGQARPAFNAPVTLHDSMILEPYKP